MKKKFCRNNSLYRREGVGSVGLSVHSPESLSATGFILNRHFKNVSVHWGVTVGSSGGVREGTPSIVGFSFNFCKSHKRGYFHILRFIDKNLLSI